MLKETRLIIPCSFTIKEKQFKAYGGPIEVRFINIAEAIYKDWDSARSAVNEDIAPFYQRDFYYDFKTKHEGSSSYDSH